MMSDAQVMHFFVCTYNDFFEWIRRAAFEQLHHALDKVTSEALQTRNLSFIVCALF